MNNLTRYDDPFAVLDGFVNYLARPAVVRRRLREQGLREQGRVSEIFPIDIEETEGGFVVTANLPGIKKENVEVSLDGNELTLAVTSREEKEENVGQYLRRERVSYAGTRKITLPERALSHEAEAVFEDGVLRVTIKKSPTAQPKKIPLR